MKTMIALVLATGALLCGCGKSEKKAAQADANAVDFVPPSVTSRADYGAAQARRFRRLDRDGDDVLTKAELPRTNTRLIALDRNKDGEITSSEFSEGQMMRFDAMDLNKDGTLTSDERVEAKGK